MLLSLWLSMSIQTTANHPRNAGHSCCCSSANLFTPGAVYASLCAQTQEYLSTFSFDKEQYHPMHPSTDVSYLESRTRISRHMADSILHGHETFSTGRGEISSILTILCLATSDDLRSKQFLLPW
ncbi:hypothetical protein BJ912DRAFT_304518 [Pholiota molesta]|nr:hypothetical protein BJ912DRAFT_304518 [Pholiota molesta]